jgi:CRISPR-associated exonuclease Cas4
MGTRSGRTSKKKHHKKSRAKHKNKRSSQIESKSTIEEEPTVISASDIERFGYCPMSWWIKHEGVRVSNEKLELGTDKHKEIITEVSSIREKQKVSKSSELNIKLFALIAIMLAMNAVALLLPLSLIRNLLIYIALLWIIIALIYLVYNLVKIKSSQTTLSIKSIQADEYSKDEQNKLKTTPIQESQTRMSRFYGKPQYWKRIAIWFLIIGGGLAFNGIAFLQPFSPEIMSRLFMISALMWLIGTMVVLYYVLSYEQTQKYLTAKYPDKSTGKLRRKLTDSEKLVMGFAVVATLLAINGLTIQQQQRFDLSQFTMIGQIVVFLAALWLGVSFTFLYISLRSRILTSRIARDLKDAPSESKRYLIAVEKIRSLSIPERVFSYNWSLFFTVVAVILGINTILIRYGSQILGEYSDLLSRFLVIIALLWLFGAFIFLYDVLKNTQLADEIRRLHGIYKGKIEYTDKLDNKSKMLYSKKHKLRGKPDYIVKINNKYIPVEIKTGKVPKGPHFSHIIQIATYCLLIEENYKIRPPYGIISYGKESKHKINYDSQLQDLLQEKIGEMRQCIKRGKAHRNHRRVGKCGSCSRRSECSEKLI